MPAEKSGYVYLETNDINGKKYIGSHCGNNPTYRGSGTLLKLAQKKYGIENFTKQIVMHCEDYRELEEQILIVLNAANDPQFYNLKNSQTEGRLGKTTPAETRAKMSAANMGKTLTAETRAKISAAKKGKTFTDEHRAKLSAARKHKKP